MWRSSRSVILLLLMASIINMLRVTARQPGVPDRGPPNPRRQLAAQIARAEALAASIRRAMAAAELRASMTQIEREFDLPRGTLGPAYVYFPSQRTEVTNHLQNSETRMQPLLHLTADGYVLYASPSLTRHVEARIQGQSLLLFKIYYRESRLVPMGFTYVHPRSLPGDDDSFLDLVASTARGTWNSLQETYGTLRIRDP